MVECELSRELNHMVSKHSDSGFPSRICPQSQRGSKLAGIVFYLPLSMCLIVYLDSLICKRNLNRILNLSPPVLSDSTFGIAWQGNTHAVARENQCALSRLVVAPRKSIVVQKSSRQMFPVGSVTARGLQGCRGVMYSACSY